MRLVHIADDGVLELNWMWLPTFIGQNHGLQQLLGAAWREKWPNGFVYTEEMLDEVHQFTLDWFANKIHIPGFREYLAAISQVKEEEDAVQQADSN
jgi:hypothetical protein